MIFLNISDCPCDMTQYKDVVECDVGKKCTCTGKDFFGACCTGKN